jgi:hypothetical protein
MSMTIETPIAEPSETVLQEAERLINGPRRDAYGDVRESFDGVASGWSRIFGCEVTAEQVALAMVWLKVMREVNRHGRDNLVDIAGYAGLAEKLT